MRPLKFYLWLFAVTSSLAAVQLVYSLQFATGVSFFTKQFHKATGTANVILSTAGPISGFLTQPIVGVLSDNSQSRWGRRRPYVLLGALITSFGMALIGCSAKIGEATTDTWGFVCAVLGLWIMNLFTNVMQGPSRALINDVVEKEYLQMANSYASAAQAAAAILGGVIAGLLTDSKDSYFYTLVIGAGAIIVVTLPTLFAAKEVPKEIDPSAKKSVVQVFVDIYIAFKTMPRYLGIIALLYFFSWCAYTPLMLNIVSYVNTDLLNGNSSDSGNYSNSSDSSDSSDSAPPAPMAYYVTSIFAAVQFCWSLVQPKLTDVFGVKFIYLATQLLATGCYISALFVEKIPALAITLLVLVSFNFAAFNSIPFALVAKYTSGASGGLFMGVLNSASVLAQVLSINACVRWVMWSKPNDPTAWGIAVGGGVFSILAFVWGFLFIKSPEQEKEEDEKVALLNETREEQSTM